MTVALVIVESRSNPAYIPSLSPVVEPALCRPGEVGERWPSDRAGSVMTRSALKVRKCDERTTAHSYDILRDISER